MSQKDINCIRIFSKISVWGGESSCVLQNALYRNII